jgi:hypothetical protein
MTMLDFARYRAQRSGQTADRYAPPQADLSAAMAQDAETTIGAAVATLSDWRVRCLMCYERLTVADLPGMCRACVLERRTRP